MADDVDLPGVGTTIATDELSGGRHAQLVKIISGEDGASTPLRVAEDGGVRTACELYTLVGMVTCGQTSYSDEEIVGGFARFDNVPSGLYRLNAIRVVHTGSVSLSGLEFHLVTYGNALGTAPDHGDDGTALVADWSTANGTISTISSSIVSFVPMPGTGGVAVDMLLNTTVNSTVIQLGLLDPLSAVDIDDTVTVQAGLVASGAIATDLSASGGVLLFTIVAERVSATMTGISQTYAS